MSGSSDFIISGGELIRYIGNDARVIIPEGVTVIKSSAFYDLDFINTVVVPVSLKKIEKDAFERCYGIPKLVVKDLKSWCGVDIDSSFMIARRGSAIYCGDRSLERLEIPDGVKTIRKYAFYGCCNIRSVTIPDSVKRIGNGAFGGCENLVEVSGMDGVNTLGECVFSSCGFRSFVIPQSVRSIGNRAFANCRMLEEINFPDGIEEMGFWYIFDDCEKLRLIHADYGKLDIMRWHKKEMVWKAVRAFSYGYVNAEYSEEMAGKWLNYVMRHRDEAFNELWDEPCFLKFMIDNNAVTAKRAEKILERYLAAAVTDGGKWLEGRAMLMDRLNETSSSKQRRNRALKELELDI